MFLIYVLYLNNGMMGYIEIVVAVVESYDDAKRRLQINDTIFQRLIKKNLRFIFSTLF